LSVINVIVQARASMDPRIAASMHLAAVHSSSAAAAALAAAANAHAVMGPPPNQNVHCVDGKLIEAVDDEANHTNAPCDVTTSSSTVAQNMVGLGRDIVPVDPEPIQKHMQDMPSIVMPISTSQQQTTYYDESQVSGACIDETTTENINDEQEFNETEVRANRLLMCLNTLLLGTFLGLARGRI